MKFVCDNCGTRYTIEDERVHQKKLKIRCRKCTHVIVVTEASAVHDPDGKASIAPEPDPSLHSYHPEPTARKQPQHKHPDPHIHSTVSHAVKPAVRPLHKETLHLAKTGAHPESSVQAEDVSCWFVAMAGKPVGPLSARVVYRHQQIHEVGSGTLVWKEGMGEWLPLDECEELSLLLHALHMRTVSLIPGSTVQAPPIKTPEQELDLAALANLDHLANRAGVHEKKNDHDEFSFDHHERASTFPISRSRPVSLKLQTAALLILLAIIGVMAFFLLGRRDPDVVVKERIVEKTRVEYRDRPLALTDQNNANGAAGNASSQAGRDNAGRGRSADRSAETAEERKQRILAEMKLGTAGRAEADSPKPASGPGLSQAQMSGVVSKNQSQLQLCYEQSMKRGEASTFQDLKANFEVLIGGSGMVRSVELSGSVTSYDGLKKCLSNSVRKWIFPSSGGESRLQFPILFTPSR